jgi:type VI secretion system secreted protein Hcp
MSIFMKFDKFKGSATEDTHKDWIDVLSFSWGASRSVHTAAGSGANRQGSHPTVQEIHITKYQDISSNKILMDLLKGGLDNKVDIAFTVNVDGKADQYMLIKLEHVGVSSFQLSDAEGTGTRATESLSLNFGKVTVTTKSVNAAGKGAPDTVGWDLAKNVSS